MATAWLIVLFWFQHFPFNNTEASFILMCSQ